MDFPTAGGQWWAMHSRGDPSRLLQFRRFRLLEAACGLLLWAAASPQSVWAQDTPLTARRGQNLLVNAGFEDASAWATVGKGFEFDSTVSRSGRRSLRCTSGDMGSTCGARQTLTFDPPIQHPFRVSGWSRAEAVELGQDYNVYLDLHYADGTPLWGQIAHFRSGTHDWEYAEHVFDVAKPVKSIEVFILLRRATGTAWFDDVKVELLPFEFRNACVLPGLYGGASLGVAATTTLPASWEATLAGPDGPLAVASGKAVPIQMAWAPTGATRPPEGCTLRLSASDALRGEKIEMKRDVRMPAARPSRGYAAWTETSMRRVLPHMLPEELADPPQAAIALAGNEYESFQIVLLAAPGRDLGRFRVELSDLVCNEQRSRIPASRIEWHQVGFVKLDKLWPHPQYPEAAPGWWPDPLLPVGSFGLQPGVAQSIWVTVYAPPGTPPGAYLGTVTLRPERGEAVRVDVRATVYGFALPVAGHLKTAFALMDGYLERLYGKPLRPELRQKYGDFVLKHRLNPDDISRTSPPAIEDLLHYRDRGMNAFNVLNMVQERGNATWVCWSPREVYTPTFKQQLIGRLGPYVEQLRRAGLADKAYIYTFDERGKDFYPIIREYFGMVKDRYPGVHTLTTAQVPQDPQAMRDLNVDWNCPLTAAYRFEQAEKCRAAGLQVWAYVCLGPRYPYANWLADDPLIEARVIWWQAFQQKMDGFLYWGLNIWDRAHNDKPLDPATGPFLGWGITTGGEWDRLHGDGELLYAGKDGPIGSIRLANIRDGLEDYEYLWLLGRQAGDIEVGRKACLPVTAGLTIFTRDPKVVYGQRETIARSIRLR